MVGTRVFLPSAPSPVLSIPGLEGFLGRMPASEREIDFRGVDAVWPLEVPFVSEMSEVAVLAADFKTGSASSGFSSCCRQSMMSILSCCRDNAMSALITARGGVALSPSSTNSDTVTSTFFSKSDLADGAFPDQFEDVEAFLGSAAVGKRPRPILKLPTRELGTGANAFRDPDFTSEASSTGTADVDAL